MAQPPVYFNDYLDDFRGGIDTNTPPRSLALSKLSFGLNLSLRGRFAQTRPPVRFITIIDPSGLLPALTGTFQGACYYKPDSGPEALFFSVSGRLFRLIPDNMGNATLSEWTIPGDLNSTTATQCWMWQAENFLIVNDGIKPPIFFDGAFSRRSLGNSATTISNISLNFTAPAVGSTVVVTLSGPYNGPIPATVVINGDTYTVIASGTSGGSPYLATMLQTGIGAPTSTPGSLLTTGLFMKPSVFYAFNQVPQTLATPTSPWGAYPGTSGTWPPAPAQLPIPAGEIRTIKISRPFTGALYSTLYLNSNSASQPAQFTVGVASISPDGMTLGLVNRTGASLGNVNVLNGSSIQGAKSVSWTTLTNATNPFPVAPFTPPASTNPTGNPSIQVNGSSNYTGTIPDYLYISLNDGTLGEFQIVAFNSNPSATFTATLENVSATMGTNYTAPLPITQTVYELPAGRMGTYGQGRVWMALTDGASFIGSDLVGSSSGTLQYHFRDAVLKVTQNVTLAGGVNFRIPTSGDTIRALAFPAQLDASLGQGPLAVFTDFSVYSCLAPTDATTWANITTPILPSALSGAGGKSQNAVVLSNSDIVFRSNTRNIRSLLLARLDFNQWGDTPVSTELIRFLQGDDPTLLTFAAGIEFDNRIIMTCHPVSSGLGVYHLGMVTMNFDEITTLEQKSPSIWEGLWTAFNVFTFVKGSFALTDRAFAFVFDTPCNTIQLYELLPESSSAIYDASDFGNSPITFGFETSDLFRGQEDADLRVFKALEDGEIAVDQVLGLVTFQVFYKNDQSPVWTPWRTFSVHVNEVVANAQPGYFPRLGLGKPDELPGNDGLSSGNTRFGHTFQVRMLVTGQCRILGGRFRASLQPEPEFVTPLDNTQPVQVISDSVVEVSDFSIYNLNDDTNPCGGPPVPPPPVPPPPICVAPTVFPTFLLPMGSEIGALIGKYKPTGTLWSPDNNSSKIYVVSTPNPVLLATVDISAFVTGGTAHPRQVIYDSVNDQMVAITFSGDLVFINPHTYAVTGNLLNIVNTSSGNGYPYASYDSKRGNLLVHYVRDSFETNPMAMVLVSGASKAILLSNSLPPVGPVGTELGESAYDPATDIFYFGNINNPQIQTFHPVTGAIAFGPLSVAPGFFVEFTRYIPELGLVFIGVADTASATPNFVQSWNTVTNATSGHLTGADVPNPWVIFDLVFNPCTNTLYTYEGTQILKFNATTLSETAKVVVSGVGGMSYVFPQNVVWFGNDIGAVPQLQTTS